MVESGPQGAATSPAAPALWGSAVLALIAAIAGTLIVRSLGLLMLDIPVEFPPLSSVRPSIFFTTIGVLGATAVFAVIRRVADQPAKVFRVVALVVLLLSFVPDFWLLTEGASSAFPGATVPGVSVLMLQHMAAALVIVWAFTMRGQPA